MKTDDRRILGVACALAALMLPSAGFASPRWAPAAPFGGSLGAIARSSSSPSIVYAANPVGEVFRSDDDAASWHRVEAPKGGRIADLLVNSGDALTVIALNGNGRLIRTQDGGEAWGPIGARLPRVRAVERQAHEPGGLIAATDGGIFRSADDGDHWARLAFPGVRVLAVASDPFEEGNLLAVIEPDESGQLFVWRSTDHGLTWASVFLADNLAFTLHSHFRFDVARPGTVYVFHDRFGENEPGPLFRSHDGGSTWVQPSTTNVRDLIVTADGTLFASPGFGVLRSTDRGDSWQATGSPLGRPNDEIFHLAASPARPRTVLATGSYGLWKSIDGGAHWRESHRGIPVRDAFEIAVAPVGPRDVLAVAEGRVFRSSDRAATWRRVHSEIESLGPYAIQFHPKRPGSLYGIGFDVVEDVLLFSSDRGTTWNQRPFPYRCNGGGSLCDVTFNVLALDPSHPETLYVNGSYFFHFGGHGPFFVRSRDGGLTWENLPTLPALLGLLVEPRRSKVLYALTQRELYKSEDAARTWRIVGQGLPGEGQATLTIDPRNPRRLYAGTNRGVFTSVDGGLTFRAMNAGIEEVQIGKILLDPSDPDRLYAAAIQAGVFRWNRGGRRWTPINDGLPVRQFFGTLALDPREPTTLYATASGSGVLRLDLADGDADTASTTTRP